MRRNAMAKLDFERISEKFKLAEERDPLQTLLRNACQVVRQNESERDRQIVPRARFSDVCGRQIHGDNPARREPESGVANGHVHALFTLLHGGVSETHNEELRVARRGPHFDGDAFTLETDICKGKQLREHGIGGRGE